ncbi:MAG: carbohydrate-binding family 9-like protein [Cyclobacteriaceae bacterium]
MKRSYILICLLLFTGANLFAQNEERLVFGQQKLFTVSKANAPITIDGKLNEKDWQKTESRTFDYFYRVEKPTDQQETTFRMLWDDKNLYLFYECKDQFITARETERDGRPYYDDCAKIFLMPAPDSLNIHMGFELNLYKASNDFVHISDYYQSKKGSVYAFNPEFEVEVTVDGTINDNSDIDRGWTMEMAIPLKLFRGLDRYSKVAAGNRWGFQAIRQERNEVEGKRRITSTIFPIYDIEKDVHQRGRFGLLEFVD